MALLATTPLDAVSRSAALGSINERLVLATAVCSELEACDGHYVDDVPAVALTLLRNWVAGRHPGHPEVDELTGLEELAVPAGAERRMADLRIATAVCVALGRLWLADTRNEVADARAEVTRALSVWRRHRWPESPPVRTWRPAPDFPAVSEPSEHTPLCHDELTWWSRRVARRRARFWNSLIEGHPLYGPVSGYVVGVDRVPHHRRHRLVWVRA